MTFRRDERGQVIVLFALALVVIIAAAGLLIDVGFGWSNRRQAQSAADTAALGAAVAAAASESHTTAAQNVAGANGFPTSYTDCGGVAQSNGVVVNRPPLSGPHSDDDDADSYVEVIVNGTQTNYFSGIVGQGCWPYSARAVAEIGSNGAASCSFCSLNRSTKNHTLLLQNGATLRVDGDIYTNSINGGVGPACTVSKWEVCGDGFDIFGDPVNPPAFISAKTISVSGGWETHDENVVMADSATWPDYSTSPPTYSACPSGKFPNPPAQTQTSNVCIHRPQITDPLNDASQAANQVPGPSVLDYAPPTALSCPSGTQFPSTNPANAAPLVITSDTTLCPGLYYGGIQITGGTTTLQPGVYFVTRKGFKVLGNGSLDGSAGVMIYNSSGAVSINILPNPDLSKPLVVARTDPVISIDSGKNPADIGKAVKYTVELAPVKLGKTTLPLSGSLTIYDGSTQVCGTSSFTNQTKKQTFTCSITYAVNEAGTHGIAGVFFSTDTCTTSACYNNAEAVLDPRQVVEDKNATTGEVTIVSSGNVKLSGMKSGPLKGMVIFSDRTSDQPVDISPGSGLGACAPNDLITVNGVTAPRWTVEQPAPDPCGALGGIEGTVYAPHEDALVTVTASGVADLQVIAGKILVTSQATARFAYDASKFAGSTVRLVE